MLRLCRFALKQDIHVVQTVRTMSKFNVKCIEGEEKLSISFDFALKNVGVPKTFNAERLQIEEVRTSLTRLSANVSKKVLKKRKKKWESDETEDNTLHIDLYNVDGETKVEDQTPVKDAFKQGYLLTIDNQKYTVDINPPHCHSIKIPQTIMVGFSIIPMLDTEFTILNDCTFVWHKICYAEQSKEDDNKNKTRKVLKFEEVSNEMIFTPTNNEIGCHLEVTCTPKSGERAGKPISTESKYEVTTGPGHCPFENRQLYTQKPLADDEIRVVCYNILADLYTDQDYSRDVLFVYCSPYALSMDYRKHLILKELSGYHSDIMCLQEVDRKIFKNELAPAFDVLGFAGSYMSKDGVVSEGSAIFHRKSKFRLVEDHSEVLRNVLETNPVCQDIVKKTYAVPELKEKLQTRSTIIHILALEPVNRPGDIVLVANTHLYFHPEAAHIRLIQTITAMRYIKTVLQSYKKQNPCLIFCGDFNSTPNRGVLKFMTTKHITETCEDWNIKGPEQFVPEMNFSHDINLASGCGLPAYTNYTPLFNGHLDYIFYDTDQLEVSQVIPPPDHKDVELHSGLPSIVFPSDHIAQICDFKWKPKPT